MSVELLTDIVLYITAAVGAASLILQGIAKVTRITPSTRDDELVSRAQHWVAVVQRVLDRLALNPDDREARPPK